MKKTSLSLYFIMFVSFCGLQKFAHIQSPAVSLSKCIGGTKDDVFYGAIQLKDSSFLFCGSTNSHDGDFFANPGNHKLDAFLMKLDTNGHIIWKKTYGGEQDEVFYNIIEDSNHELIVVGTCGSVNIQISGTGPQFQTKHRGIPGDDDVWLVKTDSAGNLKNQRCYGGTESESTFDFGMTEGLLIDKYGRIVFAGETKSNDIDVHNNHGNYDGWIVRVDPDNFDSFQSNTIGFPGFDAISNINQINDTLYISGFTSSVVYTGKNNSDLEFASDAFAAKINPTTLDTIWFRKYGGSGSEFANASVVTSDNKFVLTGHASSSDNNCVDNHGFNTWTWEIKTNDGSIGWSKFIGLPPDTSAGFSIAATHDGGVVVVGGVVQHMNPWLPDGYVIRFNSNGDTLWTKRIGQTNNDHFLAVFEEKNNGIIAAGQTCSIGMHGYHNGPSTSQRFVHFPVRKKNQPPSDAWIVQLK